MDYSAAIGKMILNLHELEELRLDAIEVWSQSTGKFIVNEKRLKNYHLEML